MENNIKICYNKNRLKNLDLLLYICRSCEWHRVDIVFIENKKQECNKLYKRQNVSISILWHL
jgi:uncharacterized protein YlaI